MKPKSVYEELEREAYINGDTILAKVYADVVDLQEELDDEEETVRRLKQEVAEWRTRNEY
jgi:hypothetical protein